MNEDIRLIASKADGNGDSMIAVYAMPDDLTRDQALAVLVNEGLFASCGHDHDCCGCWVASHIADFHHAHGQTVVAVRFYRNV